MAIRIEEREQAEVARSAASAARTCEADLLVEAGTLRRYSAPPAETCYPMEYAYHLLGDVRGRTVLEYGCGDGSNTVLLAHRGARVIALDISPELISVARRRLAVNGITSGVNFIVGSAHDLPLQDETIDVVFGMVILHHLELAPAAREVRRVLRRGGRAIFREPVRNSALLGAARRLIPYRSPDVSPFERPLTDGELRRFADGFSSFHAKVFQLPSTNLIKLLPPLRPLLKHCYAWDAALLKRVPALRRFATTSVLEMVK